MCTSFSMQLSQIKALFHLISVCGGKNHVGSILILSCFWSDNEIVCFLKVQLAEAINLQDKNLMAQLQETMRCVSRFDNRTCRKLLASIAEDYR